MEVERWNKKAPQLRKKTPVLVITDKQPTSPTTYLVCRRIYFCPSRFQARAQGIVGIWVGRVLKELLGLGVDGGVTVEVGTS